MLINGQMGSFTVNLTNKYAKVHYFLTICDICAWE